MFDRPVAIRARLRAPVLLALSIGLLWFAFEALVYRSGAYVRIAEPDSNTGAVVTKLAVIEDQYRSQARNILVLGDSRVGEGFSSPRAAGGDAGFNFINVSVPGSTARTWYYLLREIDRRGYRFDAIVIGTIYRDPRAGLRADWSLDPAHATALVDLGDAVSFPASFESPQMRERARHAVLFPALALREDTRALLQNPYERHRKIRKERPGFLAAVRDYSGRDDAMPALRFSADGRSVLDWRDTTPQQRGQLEAFLAEQAPRPAAEVALNDAFLGRWLGAIAQLAHKRGAPLMLYPLPRGPYREALGEEPPLPPSLQALQREPGVTVLPADTLGPLERPEYFFDALHANRAGRELTSARVGAAARALLEPALPQ